MSYHLACSCGREIAVTADQAGTQVRCSCGRTVAVPLLSQLRLAAGKGAYEAGIVDTIHCMIADGRLPHGNCCAISGLPTDDVVTLSVQCERKHLKRTDGGHLAWVVLGILLLPLFALLRPATREHGVDEDREIGRDVIVPAPLRVHREQRGTLAKTRSQRTLRGWLQSVPIYAQLFDEYPEATVIVPPSADPSATS